MKDIAKQVAMENDDNYEDDLIDDYVEEYEEFNKNFSKKRWFLILFIFLKDWSKRYKILDFIYCI